MKLTEAAAGSPDELAAVRHLAVLGYVDPWETAVRRGAAERALQATFQQAEELLRKGELAPAIELLEVAARDAPDWTAGRHLLARAYFRSGRFDAAESLLQWLELHAVEHAELAYQRAAIAIRRRHWDQARDHAEYAVHLAGTLPAAQLIIAEALLRRGDLEAAESAYRALDQPAQAAAAGMGLAAVALRRGEFEEAAALALEALDLDARGSGPHLLLGRALMGLQRWPEARVALEACICTLPTQPAPYRWLSEACDKSGDRAAAAEARRRGRNVVAQRRAARR